MRDVFLNEYIVGVATLTHCFLETLSIISDSFNSLYRIAFLVFIFTRLHHSNESPENRPIHLFAWFVWQSHGWLPQPSSSALPAIIYIALSLCMYISIQYNLNERVILSIILLICYNYDAESRPGSYGTILNIIRTFLFWADRLVFLCDFYLYNKHKLDEAQSYSYKITRGAWILWTHPFLLPLSAHQSVRKLISIWKKEKAF
jgi:hypothetical protein